MNVHVYRVPKAYKQKRNILIYQDGLLMFHISAIINSQLLPHSAEAHCIEYQCLIGQIKKQSHRIFATYTDYLFFK